MASVTGSGPVRHFLPCSGTAPNGCCSSWFRPTARSWLMSVWGTQTLKAFSDDEMDLRTICAPPLSFVQCFQTRLSSLLRGKKKKKNTSPRGTVMTWALNGQHWKHQRRRNALTLGLWEASGNVYIFNAIMMIPRSMYMLCSPAL